MAPAIGRLAPDNGSCGSIPGDQVAPPPQNIHQYLAEKTLFEYYQLICFTKNNLKSLYKSADKVYWLDNYLSSIEEL